MYRYYCVCVCVCVYVCEYVCLINIFGHCPQELVTGGEILLRNVKLGGSSFSVADRLLKIPPSVCVCMAQRGGPLDGF
jgi:hypothetical protein